MARIGIIINPHAKKNKRARINPLNRYRELGGDLADVRATQSLDEVFTVAESFKKSGIEYLGICGGDGTLHHVLSRFMYVYRDAPLPPIVILKGGTMDTVSRSIGLTGAGPEIMRRLMDRLADGGAIDLFSRDTIRIGDRYCFLFGLGLTSNFLTEYYRGGDTGPLKAVTVALKGIASGILGLRSGNLFTRFTGRVIVNGEELWFSDFLGILAGTVEEIGIGFRPLSRAYERDGAFHTIFAGCKPITVALQVNRFRTGRPLRDPNYHDCVTDRFIVTGPPKFQYMMDGDLYEANSTLTVESGPAVRLVRV
ncbi:MAG TPA: diacylglycerol kinase family protein [Spirochaetota bacterium]|nr:diacylglycerol kinase family protein [Spirochaetota bacterium]HNT11558.1 diacylglycerol kinase family protein [Spirochaetota bacterium]HNV45905.1 diacylglycerol kinase family protein [Spirochaetota bacterium]HOS40156.1 diacylglycerol kinase family protein [Spirochaetota bacterium]HPU90293.1 diacylglycerol kinase family protein [Spirochaetota bacterium]